jgi:hypothetical protein
MRAGDGGAAKIEETGEAAALTDEETQSAWEVWTRGMPSYRRNARENRGDRWRLAHGMAEARAGACVRAADGPGADRMWR